mmetsp:Transcript_12962/g.28232  ORF Transcript_12962/g.28232 Transcript_12962/m.28232 type:complete len:238 (+) Transcript_12962:60-773(+)
MHVVGFAGGAYGCKGRVKSAGRGNSWSSEVGWCGGGKAKAVRCARSRPVATVMSGLGEDELGANLPDLSQEQMDRILHAQSKKEMMEIVTEYKEQNLLRGKFRVSSTDDYFARLSLTPNESFSSERVQNQSDISQPEAAEDASTRPWKEDTPIEFDDLPAVAENIRGVYRRTMSNQAANSYLDTISKQTSRSGSPAPLSGAPNTLATALTREIERYNTRMKELDDQLGQNLRRILNQ